MLKLDKASGTGLARRIFSAAILAIVSLSMLLLSPFSFWLLLGESPVFVPMKYCVLWIGELALYGEAAAYYCL